MDKPIIQGDTCCLLVASLAAAGMGPQKVEEATFLVLPPGYQQHDISKAIEKENATPKRKHGTVTLASVESLVQYLKDQAKPDVAYVFADLGERTITAVFNDQRSELPGWRDHRAVYKAEHTPEWILWAGQNKKKFSQTEFAEFIEDNIADLSGEEGNTLLKVATTIAATSGINFASARRLQDGQTQLTYNEDIDAKAGVDGDMKIPQKFTLGIRIFRNGEPYAITARLKYRLASGAISFFYELERPERSVEDAFKGYVDQVRADSGYTVLLGKA